MGVNVFYVSPFCYAKKGERMKKFRSMQELLAYMAGIEIPNELKNAVAENMHAVEECNNGGATAYLIIAETKAEAKQVEKEYALSNCAPEYSRIINTLDGAYWKQSVFVFSDDGGGIIYFERVPLLP